MNERIRELAQQAADGPVDIASIATGTFIYHILVD